MSVRIEFVGMHVTSNSLVLFPAASKPSIRSRTSRCPLASETILHKVVLGDSKAGVWSLQLGQLENSLGKPGAHDFIIVMMVREDDGVICKKTAGMYFADVL